VGDSGYTSGDFWWPSVWPLFAASLLASALLGATAGLGGLGSVIVGLFMAARFAARPSYSFTEAYRRGIVPMVVVVFVLGFLVGFGVTVEQLGERGWEPGASKAFAALLLLGQALLYGLLLCAAWAAAVVHRAKVLRARAG
jgi:hypothetical protein